MIKKLLIFAMLMCAVPNAMACEWAASKASTPSAAPQTAGNSGAPADDDDMPEEVNAILKVLGIKDPTLIPGAMVAGGMTGWVKELAFQRADQELQKRIDTRAPESRVRYCLSYLKDAYRVVAGPLTDFCTVKVLSMLAKQVTGKPMDLPSGVFVAYSSLSSKYVGHRASYKKKMVEERNAQDFLEWQREKYERQKMHSANRQ